MTSSGIGPALFNQDPLVYLMYIGVPVAAYILLPHAHGLHLRAVGEDPATADAMGILVPQVCATWRRLPVASLWGWAAHT
ncbi:MAG: hypothetical protein R2856_32015 [Caldilineaceae bacterium]